MSDGSFLTALTEHLSAVQSRDIERFAATVGDEVAVVDGSGAVVSGRDTVLRSHAEWFASPDPWTFAYELRAARDCGSAGFALIDVTYRQNENAAPARFLLVLFFERTSGGEWKFIYDQNTPLAVAAVR